MASDEKKEKTIRLHLNRPVDNGEFQSGSGEADVPESFASQLIANGVATVVTKKKGAKTERGEKADATAEEVTDSGEDVSRRGPARKR